jgi:hypothetical protein
MELMTASDSDDRATTLTLRFDSDDMDDMHICDMMSVT